MPGKIIKKSRAFQGKNLTQRQKLRLMKVLEQCDMNESETARATGMSRVTIRKYRSEYWDEYLKHKNGIKDEILTIEAAKREIKTGISEIVGEYGDKSLMALEKIGKRIRDDEYYIDKNGYKHYLVETKDLVQLVNVLAPYLADKRGVKGLDEKDGPSGASASFVQNIINVMNQRANSPEEDNDKTIEEGQADDIC